MTLSDLHGHSFIAGTFKISTDIARVARSLCDS